VLAASDVPAAAKASDPARPGPAGGAGYRLLLDGKGVRTPAKRDLRLATRALAAAIAEEWQAQGDHIDPNSMPLTRFANSAIDGVAGRGAEVRADILKYLATDLVCYRAAEPSALVERQAEVWDPILAWSNAVLGTTLKVGVGVVPVAQPEAAGRALAVWLEALDAFQLTAMHAMTTLLGSAVLALAHALGRLDREAAWAAAHVDEDFQAERWGVDRLAKARRDRQWRQLEAASRLFTLARGDQEALGGH
jgi:chaperone required for assembly of F1-ATPase